MKVRDVIDIVCWNTLRNVAEAFAPEDAKTITTEDFQKVVFKHVIHNANIEFRKEQDIVVIAPEFGEEHGMEVLDEEFNYSFGVWYYVENSNFYALKGFHSKEMAEIFFDAVQPADQINTKAIINLNKGIVIKGI